MKLHVVNFMVAVSISALVAYGLWSMDGELKNFVAVGSFVFMAGTLVPSMGIDFESARRAVNLRAVCGIFFAIGLGINAAFSLVGASQTAYVLVNAITFLIFVVIANSIYNANQ